MVSAIPRVSMMQGIAGMMSDGVLMTKTVSVIIITADALKEDDEKNFVTRMDGYDINRLISTKCEDRVYVHAKKYRRR